MKIDPKYGPQYDAGDGTIGKLQLVKRWAPATPDGWLWGPAWGHRMRATKEEAEAYLASVRKANSAAAYPVLATLSVAWFWCYPNHFDPAHCVAPETQKETWS